MSLVLRDADLGDWRWLSGALEQDVEVSGISSITERQLTGTAKHHQRALL